MRDKELLDWLEENLSEVTRSHTGFIVKTPKWDEPIGGDGCGITLRQATENAIKNQDTIDTNQGKEGL